LPRIASFFNRFLCFNNRFGAHVALSIVKHKIYAKIPAESVSMHNLFSQLITVQSLLSGALILCMAFVLAVASYQLAKPLAFTSTCLISATPVKSRRAYPAPVGVHLISLAAALGLGVWWYTLSLTAMFTLGLWEDKNA
jgi:hypothetical protein